MTWSKGVLNAAYYMSRCDKGEQYSEHRCVPFYNRLLIDTFITTPYIVAPAYCPGDCPKKDHIPLVLQYNFRHVVLFVEVFSETRLDNPDERERADAKMRRRFGQLADEEVRSQKMYGICAFGSRVALYVYDRESGLIEPPHRKRGKPPIRWWDLDVMGDDGQKEFFARIFEPVLLTARRDLEDPNDIFAEWSASKVMEQLNRGEWSYEEEFE